MKKAFVLIALLLVCGSLAGAQETYFGKNKVQYRNFEWNYIQTDHFDIYFYDDGYNLAKFTAKHMEDAYQIIAEQLKYYVARRVPVFIYNSQNDFQQTNIVWDMLSEGTQGFTEVFKNRIVLHFMGSYEEFRHLIHHELTHAVIYDMLYGQFFKSIISSNRLFSLPLWFAEGYAEYSSNGGWTMEADMMVRDATINGYLQPPEYMEFLSYTEGFALVKYIVDNYGIDKLHEILARGKAMTTMDRALKSSIGMDAEELYDKFSKEMRKRYWPDISLREEPKDFAKQLTNHEKDDSHYNERPVFSPKGKLLAIFSDRGGYTEIVLISAIDGKVQNRLVKGERTADLESLHWYTSGMSFSPDGDTLVFVSKARGEDALNFLKLADKDIYRRRKFGLKSIISPAWSPDGRAVIFTALSGPSRDLFLYNLKTDSLQQLTHDRYDDNSVSWYPDSRRIIFSSDRPHPDDYAVVDTTVFTYGAYNLHEMDLGTGQVVPVRVGPGQNTEPAVSPDGRRVAFASNRSGIENIYVYYVDSSRVIAATNALTNAKSPSWSPDGKMIAFSTFYKAGYDVYVIRDVEPKGNNGILMPTDFVQGKFDNRIEWARGGEVHDRTGEADTALAGSAALRDPDFPVMPADSASAWMAQVPDQATEIPGDTGAVTAPAATGDTAKAADTSAVPARPAPPPGDEDEYVFTAPPDSSVFAPMGELTAEGGEKLLHPEPSVDSLSAAALDNVLPDGEYRIRRYKTKFTPDVIAGGLQYDSFFGFRGQSVFVFSDYLGDHQILIATDLVNTIDQSNIQAYYLYNRMRVDLGIGLFHTKNYYLDPDDQLFSDRFYGLTGFVSWPRSKFTRIELNAGTSFIDRKFYDTPLRPGRHVRVSSASLNWIHDTVLWGITGPVNGRRFKLSIEGATPIFGDESINYYAGEFDYRQYLSLGKSFSVSLRTSGGYSAGSAPKNYFLGGNTNRIGNVSVGADVYNVENLYFAGIVTPLRGYDYYDLVGTRYAVANMELHFPFIEYFLMRYPLHLGLTRVTGALFTDIGAAWNDHDGFKGGTSKGGTRLLGIKTGFGFGARANLGFLVLRYDLAWRTDFHSVEPHTKHYFSLGADF
jgi:Tol biopolymer transport system component